MEIKRCNTSEEALDVLTQTFLELINAKESGLFHLAISGGDTPKSLFRLWVDQYKEKVDWMRIRFYWVDERCVFPDDPQSNYGQAKQLLFDPLNIPEKHVFRMRGEADPYDEAKRYALLLNENVPLLNGFPRFDCIMLGVGNDMHTASLFPDNLSLLSVHEIVAVSRHPETGQKRITLTGWILLNDTPLLVPVIGVSKAPVVDTLEKGFDEKNPTPSAYILHNARLSYVFTDAK